MFREGVLQGLESVVTQSADFQVFDFDRQVAQFPMRETTSRQIVLGLGPALGPRHVLSAQFFLHRK